MMSRLTAVLLAATLSGIIGLVMPPMAHASSSGKSISSAAHPKHKRVKRKAQLATIPPAFYKASALKQVPADLLYSISLQESQLVTNKGRIIPWPWTVNWQGRGYRFNTRAKMYAFCQRLLKNGYRSFDVGLAQVNWRWHADRFNGDLWAATDPWINLTAAASYLKERYDVSGNWWTAAGEYHHPTNTARATSYRQSVHSRWKKVQALLAQK